MTKEYLRINCDRHLEDIVDDIIKDQNRFPEEYFELKVILNDDDPYYRVIRRNLLIEEISYAKTAQIMRSADREMHMLFKEYKYYLDDPIKIRYISDTFAEQYRKRTFDKQYFSMIASLMGAVDAENARLTEIQRIREDEERISFMMEHVKIVDQEVKSYGNVVNQVEDKESLYEPEILSIDNLSNNGKTDSRDEIINNDSDDQGQTVAYRDSGNKEDMGSETDIEDRFAPFKYTLTIHKEDMTFDSKGVVFEGDVVGISNSVLITDHNKEHYRNLLSKSNRSQVFKIYYKAYIQSIKIRDYRYFVALTTQPIYSKRFRDFKNTIISIDEVVSEFEADSIFMKGMFDLSSIYRDEYHKFPDLVEVDGVPKIKYYLSVITLSNQDGIVDEPVFKYSLNIDVTRIMWWAKSDSLTSVGRIRYYQSLLQPRSRRIKLSHSYNRNLQSFIQLVNKYNQRCRFHRGSYVINHEKGAKFKT